MLRFFFIITVFLLFFSRQGQASELQLGVSVGPSFVRNTDFNGANAKTFTHLTLGLNLAYPITCQSRFCEGLFVEPGFAMSLVASSDFGSTRVASTGLTGNYSESAAIYSGNVSFKKHFRLKSKITAFVLSGLGASYFKLSDIRFTDALGEKQALNVSETSLNLNFNVGAGLSYAAGNRVLVDVAIIPYVVFPQVTDQSYLTVPVGIHYAF